MPDIRDKILDAIDGHKIAFADLTTNALVDVLIDQLRRTKSSLLESRNAILKEGLRDADIERSASEEIRRVRTDPTYAAHGDFYFDDGTFSGPIYTVSIGGIHNIRMYRHADGIDFVMRQMTPEAFHASRAKRT